MPLSHCPSEYRAAPIDIEWQVSWMMEWCLQFEQWCLHHFLESEFPGFSPASLVMKSYQDHQQLIVNATGTLRWRQLRFDHCIRKVANDWMHSIDSSKSDRRRVSWSSHVEIGQSMAIWQRSYLRCIPNIPNTLWWTNIAIENGHL